MRLKPAPSRSDGGTAAEAAIDLLKRDIVLGVLQPDTKLKMRLLKERYRIGASPMREALAQLAAQGLVHQMSQKGFRVPPLAPADLLDITRSRQLIEPEAVKLAMAHATPTWEDEIVASFHLLVQEMQRSHLREGERGEDFEVRHHRFHRALIAACPLAALKSFCDALYMQATRYRMLLRTYRFSADVVIAEHRILMEAVLGRKKQRAAEALRLHIGLTADVLLGQLEDGGWESVTRSGRAPMTTRRKSIRTKIKRGRK